MSTTTGDTIPADELVELEPTMQFDLAESAASSPGIAVASATLTSMAGETDDLRRKRLLAAAVFLAATFALLGVWTYASDNPSTLTAQGGQFSIRVALIGLRCILAT